MRTKTLLGLILAAGMAVCGCNFPQETKMEPVNAAAKENAKDDAAKKAASTAETAQRER